jgi:hypothetical protein
MPESATVRSTCRAPQDAVASRWASSRRGNPASSHDKFAARTAGSPKWRYGCGLYVSLNNEVPEFFQLDERIEPHGCCNALNAMTACVTIAPPSPPAKPHEPD